MSFNWSDYLDVAQELIEKVRGQAENYSQQEANLRSAISRAYYAAFGMARDHLHYKDKIPEPRPLVDRKGNRVRNIHEYVRERFKSSSNIQHVEIGEHLERLSDYRNKADYDLNGSIFNKPLLTAQVTLKWAREVLASLKRIERD